MKITVTEYTHKEVEVTFPAFFKEANSKNPYYAKAIGEREYIRLFVHRDGDFSVSRWSSSPDEFFSNKYEPISEIEFEQKLKEAIERAAALSQNYYFSPPIPVSAIVPPIDEPVKVDPLP